MPNCTHRVRLVIDAREYCLICEKWLGSGDLVFDNDIMDALLDLWMDLLIRIERMEKKDDVFISVIDNDKEL